MYTVYLADTPNGRKITIALEELGLAYQTRFVDLNAGEQHAPAFARLSPNNKIPVLTDERTGQSLFESCAILIHLADAAGQALPAHGPDRELVLQWLFLQAASAGPMLGQLWWFRHAAPEPNAMALERYTRETQRVYGVIERRLAGSRHIGGDAYTIADMAFYPWLETHGELGIDIGRYPAVADWLHRLGGRPAVRRGMLKAREEAHV